jgi:hypothetical protein
MNAPHTPTPWSVEAVRNEGDYGDGGPDCRSGFDSFSVVDASGRVVADTLNSDHRICLVQDECDEDGMRAWDEQGQKNAAFIVRACNAHDDLVAALRAIRDARDHNAEHGEYPPGMLDGACFDDWAADIAATALAKAGAA